MWVLDLPIFSKVSVRGLYTLELQISFLFWDRQYLRKKLD